MSQECLKFQTQDTALWSSDAVHRGDARPELSSVLEATSTFSSELWSQRVSDQQGEELGPAVSSVETRQVLFACFSLDSERCRFACMCPGQKRQCFGRCAGGFRGEQRHMLFSAP